MSARRVGRGRELASVAHVMGRFWLTALPLVRAQLHEWERLAETIPDPALRTHALDTLRGESFSAMGAALVAMTVDGCDPNLVRLLVALQIAWDYIDTLAEQPAGDPVANGVQLHRALVDALSADPPRGDYYRLNPQGDDGGYLAALVAACRDAGRHLPTYRRVRATALHELETAEIQYLNHGPLNDRAGRLMAWARRHPADDADWVELSAAASSSLGVLAIVALAADPGTTAAEVDAVRAAYVPWVDALTALLDSLVDRPDDAASGCLNWVSHYPSDEATAARLAQITSRAVGAVRALPNGERHVVIVVGMIAMHLSRPTAWLPEAKPATRAVLRATGSPVTRPMLALLRTWRRARAPRAGDPASQGLPAAELSTA